MELTGDLATILAVAGVIIAVALYNYAHAKRATTKQVAPVAEDDHGEPVDPMLCKFVIHEGQVVGETVSISAGNLILKQAGTFKSVPKSMAQLVSGEVVLTGAVNWEESIAAGTLWHQDNTRGIDAAITSDLTKSEDIRNPALEAFKARQEDSADAPARKPKKAKAPVETEPVEKPSEEE